MAVDGLDCTGQFMADERWGDLWPFKECFSMVLPSLDVMSDSVKICRNNLQLFRIFRVSLSEVYVENAVIKNLSCFLCLEGNH